MTLITTWYKKALNGDYKYNHFTYGHTTTNKTNWLYKNCHLDTSKKINEVTE